jgi:hypothetical protein
MQETIAGHAFAPRTYTGLRMVIANKALSAPSTNGTKGAGFLNVSG